MIRAAKWIWRLALASIAAGGLLLFGDHVSVDTQQVSMISQASARIGRPLTPLSYAGVARRTTRRGAAVGAAVATSPYYLPGCYQVVDAYGRIYWRCP
jgi:hypothetical protein